MSSEKIPDSLGHISPCPKISGDRDKTDRQTDNIYRASQMT